MAFKLIFFIMGLLFVSQVNAQTSARLEGDPISAALLEQSGYESDSTPVSGFAVRKAEADAQKGHYRTRYVGRKNRIVAEKEETQYEEPAYGTPNELEENVLDPTAVASVGMAQSLSMLGQSGRSIGMNAGLNQGFSQALGQRSTMSALQPSVLGNTGLGMRAMQGHGFGSSGTASTEDAADITGIGGIEGASDTSSALIKSDLMGRTSMNGLGSRSGFSALDRNASRGRSLRKKIDGDGTNEASPNTLP